MKSNRNRLFVALTLCLLSFSCADRAIYDRYQIVQDVMWEKDKIFYFTFEITDNSIPYDVYVGIRNNNLYPYQNLWVFCGEESPIGSFHRDTIEYYLADDFGKWTGSGISLYHSSFPIHQHYLFPHTGQYTISFQHGMRDEVLKGIQDIGLRIEPSKGAK